MRCRRLHGSAIADGSHLVHVSVANLWEIGINEAFGKLRVPRPIAELLAANRFDVIPITSERVAQAVMALPPHDRDPFDCMLIAQAKQSG